MGITRGARIFRDHERVGSALRDFLTEDAGPVSVREACSQLDVSIGYLAYRFPGELRKLRLRCGAHRAHARARKERERKIRIHEIVSRLARSGSVPSAEQVAVVFHGDEQRRSSGSLNRLIRQVLIQFIG